VQIAVIGSAVGIWGHRVSRGDRQTNRPFGTPSFSVSPFPEAPGGMIAS